MSIEGIKKRLEQNKGQFHKDKIDMSEDAEWLIKEVERLKIMLETAVPEKGLFLVVGESRYLEYGLIRKLESWGVKDTDLVIEELKKSGKWTNGKNRVMAIR